MAMNLDTVNINFNEVIGIADRIKGSNAKLTATLADTQGKINELEQDWMSDTSSAIREKITSLSGTISTYERVIQDYVNFLNGVVASYELSESALKQGAETTLSKQSSLLS